MVTVDNRILQDVAAEVAAREEKVSFQDVKAKSRASGTPEVIDVRSVLLGSGCNVIAAFDRMASDFSDHQNPADFAARVEELGVAMLSYTVRRGQFATALQDIQDIRLAVTLPLLLDDLIVDPYQIHEARVLGADALPLAVWAMDQHKLESLLDRTEALGMTALVEVRNPDEARRAVAAGASVVAVDVTGYHGSHTLPEAFAGICEVLPKDTVRLVLGGCWTPRELMAYACHSADAIYVPHNPLAATKSLVSAGMHPACPSR